MNTDSTTRRHQVVVIGSGFGGLFGAKALRKADVDVTMVARTTHHLFQPLLYQVATGILSEGEIAPPTREILARQKNAQVMLGDVTAIDLARQFASEPLAAIIYTDIATDGMMRGPNIAAMVEMQAAVEVPIVASGGVTTIDDVARLAAAGLPACIIGRALYEGTLSLAEAIRVAGSQQVTKAI